MKKVAQALIGLVIGLTMVWLLFRGTNWSAVGDAIQGINLGWLLLSQVPMWLMFPVRVQRWTYIVRADRPARFKHLFSATQIGFLANFTLPGRAGEAIRALVLNRLTGIPFSRAFAMVALDRVTDLFGLIAIMLVGIFAFQPVADVIIPAETFATEGPIVFPQNQYQMGAIGAGLGMLVILSSFVLLYVKRELVLKISGAILGLVSKKFANFVDGLLNNFADGMHIFKSPSDMSKSIGFSLLTWSGAVMFLYCINRAFFPEIPWYLPFVMQSILAVFISVPGAPGFVGQFHIPIVITLVMLIPDMNVDHAKAAAIIIHLLQLPPVALLGVYSLMTENLGLMELQREGQELAEHDGEGESDG